MQSVITWISQTSWVTKLAAAFFSMNRWVTSITNCFHYSTQRLIKITEQINHFSLFFFLFFSLFMCLEMCFSVGVVTSSETHSMNHSTAKIHTFFVQIVFSSNFNWWKFSDNYFHFYYNSVHLSHTKQIFNHFGLFLIPYNWFTMIHTSNAHTST